MAALQAARASSDERIRHLNRGREVSRWLR